MLSTREQVDINNHISQILKNKKETLALPLYFEWL